MDKVKLVKTLPASFQNEYRPNYPRDRGRPRNYVIERGESTVAVARIRFVAPGNSELFELLLMWLERPTNSFRNGKGGNAEITPPIQTLLYPGDCLRTPISRTRASKRQ